MWFVFQDTLRVVTVVPASVLHGSAADRGPEDSVGPSGSAPARGRARRPLQRNHRQGKPFTGEAIQRNPVGQADWVKLEM
ncbi:unnamed protein product [Arctogadus glacialis]